MIVEFNPTKFRETFPDAFPVAGYSDVYLQSCFDRACAQISNEESSPVPFSQRGSILYLTTAHIATIGKRDPNMVGQITSAGQGSTNVSISGPVAIGSEAWWLQTSYGQEAWQATASYRSFLWAE